MFLSLKGAIGRNPMLNRVGQKLLQSFGGASAAYSLRNLASNIASVVRVRRASDNSEKDFSAADISSGAMTGWVNSQIVPPLDIRELDSNGERTGALVEAAAAYSLRNLSSSYTGDVVVVRRSSDDAEELFTAAEVADGTLEDWVNTDVNTGPSSGVYTKLSGTGTISNATINSFDVDAGAAGQLATNHTGSFRVEEGETVKVNATITGDFTSGSIILVSGSSFVSTTLLYGTNDYELTAPSDLPFADLRLNSLSSTTGFSFVINSIQIIKSNGYVVIWYDQSGNGNHATQTTNASQPKIVDGGSLVTRGGNSKPSILFGGAADNYLDVVGRPLTRSVFSTLQVSNTNFETLICDTTDNSPRLTTNNAANNRAYKFEGFGTPSVNIDGVTYNGTSSVSSFGFHLLGMTSVTGSAIDRIGANPAVSATGNSFNFVSELILYPDDQSDNRTAIEANIGETYGIDLPSGVDTGYDEVDGFVETWYDQSGNGNDAVQAVAGSQPKIVDAGVLVSGGLDFDGSPSAMDIDGLVLESTEYYMTAVIHLDAVPSNSLKTIFDCTDAVNAGASLAYANTSSQLTPFMLDGDDTSVNVFGGGANLTTSKTLVGCQFKSGASESYINGGINSTLSNTWTSAGTNTFTKSTIGYDQSTPGRNMDGKLAELIVYESDQSANRAAIEANINNQYDIY